MNAVSTNDLHQWLNTILQPQRFRDYCPNGLQLEGKPEIRHIITGVTASQALIDAAAQRGADAVLVHHGWFWKNEDPCIRGPKHRRIAQAIAHGLNVFAYHLPLDAHPELGNNAQLGRILGFEPERTPEGEPVHCGPEDLIWMGRVPEGATLELLAGQVHNSLGRAPLFVGNPQQSVRRIAWCTGGAQGMMEAAVQAGADAYLTGEASEQNFHLAHETGTGFIAAGHHATERYGVKALGEAVAREFGIRVEFLDLDNPI